MTRYAESTSVPADRSRAEIERVLTRYGATGFMYGWQGNTAQIRFELANRSVKFVLPMPDITDREFNCTPTGKGRGAAAATAAHAQAVRQRWRALLLVIKAKLEAIEAGISVFDDEFLAHILMPDGVTVSEHVRPRLEAAYLTGQSQPLLPDLRSKS